MNISNLLNQTAVWQTVASTNDRDDITYAAGVTLPCRMVQKLRDVIGKDGEVTTATNCYTLMTEVTLGDVLDGRQVISLESMTTFSGSVIGWLAFTR